MCVCVCVCVCVYFLKLLIKKRIYDYKREFKIVKKKKEYVSQS